MMPDRAADRVIT